MNRTVLAATVAAASVFSSARADEGMWLFSSPPRDQIKAKYGFDVTDTWLNHLMKASVRFNSGGSGSFVSEDGLVITNHHVGADDLQKMSSEAHNYLKDGFYAKTEADEIKCLDLELNVLQSIVDVTDQVKAAIPANPSIDSAALAKRKVIAAIEKASVDATGLRSDVVTLYQGGVFHLYRYKRYTDVRLVFAPEVQAAFYGGDPDNFEFPRYNLDVCFFRVYENNQPVKSTDYLKWSTTGAKENDLAFVSGHPGRTSRLLTVPELAFLRDIGVPMTTDILKRREVLLLSWSGRSIENARRAREALFRYQNSRKVRDGQLAVLDDPAFFAGKVAAEDAFKGKLAGRPQYAAALESYARIAKAQAAIDQTYKRYRLIEMASGGFDSDSFVIARDLLRSTEERAKPNGDRMPEYTDSKTASLTQKLFSDKPIYENLEILTLGDSLTFLTETLGADDPTVKQILVGKSPRARATELIKTTQVRDVAFRKRLYAGGKSAVDQAHDPLIEFARMVDPEARALRKAYEAQDEVKQQAQAAISKARFAIEGASRYPDATLTLRLSYGVIKGYEENGEHVNPITHYAGLYARSTAQENKPPFDLSQRWIENKSALDLSVAYNFVTTADIIGGNSGSPTVNQAGEFIGIIFDGNIHTLIGEFGYEDVQARSLSVDSAGILEAMRKIYKVDPLADELVNGRR